jgi:hypothetical protein
VNTSASLITAAVVRCSGGLDAYRERLQHILFACFVSGIIYVIHGLDTPLTGLSREELQPITHLKTVIDREISQKP